LNNVTEKFGKVKDTVNEYADQAQAKAEYMKNEAKKATA
jgi:hypothetical protein